DEDKIAEVVGLAAAVPLDKADPRDPINRRISIIVLTKTADAAVLSQTTGTVGLPDPTTPPPTAALHG
ncbi:MAG: hypothetical protein ACRD1F_11830, partial [Terriglobales bacterium]